MKDPLPAHDWDTDRSIMFNVNLINAITFGSLGLPVPSTTVTAMTYAMHGFPFFKIYEEPTQIYGDFKAVKTVGEIDEEEGINDDIHDSEELLDFDEVQIGRGLADEICTCTVKLNAIDAISRFLPLRFKQEAEVKEESEVSTSPLMF